MTYSFRGYSLHDHHILMRGPSKYAPNAGATDKGTATAISWLANSPHNQRLGQVVGLKLLVIKAPTPIRRGRVSYPDPPLRPKQRAPKPEMGAAGISGGCGKCRIHKEFRPRSRPWIEMNVG